MINQQTTEPTMKFIIDFMRICECDDNFQKCVSHDCIEKITDINFQDNDGYTLLMYAIKYHKYIIAQKIIESGADLNLKNKYGHTALMMLTMDNKRDYTDLFITQFIEKGVELDIQDDFGNTALMYAAETSKSKDVELLLSFSVNHDIRNNEGLTALLIAVIGYDIKCANLLAKSSCINICDEFGKTPLMYACEHYNPEMIEMLLINGADKYTTDNNGNSSFEHLSINSNSLDEYQECKRILTRYGEPIDEDGTINEPANEPANKPANTCISEEHKKSLLATAVNFQQYNIVEIILKMKPSFDNEYIFNTMEDAIIAGDEKMFKLLADHY